MYEIAAFRIDDVSEGGLIYTRTDIAYNIIPSSEGTIYYECKFEDCNIQWVR